MQFIKHYLYISFVYAIGFGILETIMRQLNYYFIQHTVTHIYTTPQQFLLTFCWTPFILFHKKINNTCIRIITYPINIYMCEIIGGYLMYYFFSYRIWHYTDNYALFDGMITLLFYPLWIFLYFIEHYFYIFIK